MDEKTFTVGEVSGLFLGISPSWLRYRERQGVLPSARKVGRDRAYTLDDIEAISSSLLEAGLVDVDNHVRLKRRIKATRDWLEEMARNPVLVRDPAGRGPESGRAYADRTVTFPKDSAIVMKVEGRWYWYCALCHAQSRITWVDEDPAQRACHMHNANTHDPRTR